MYKILFAVVLLLCSSFLNGQLAGKTTFKVVPLGIRGGLDESNLSCYMIAPKGSDAYVCADAGTVRFGIEKAVSAKLFKVNASTVFKSYIKGYLISHGHLDHLSGLIINSPEDTIKNIYAMPYVLDVLKQKYFTWESWANFADDGEKPALGKYHYVRLSEDVEMSLANTDLFLRTFALSHASPYQSTAFLLRSGGNYLLYFGDTGADTIEKSDRLKKVWHQVAPLVRSGKLKGIFIEVSYSNRQPENQLFGHLTPKLLMQEMAVLEAVAGPGSLKGLPLVVTHIKPTAGAEGNIRKELGNANRFGLRIMYPVQGRVMEF